MANKPKIAIGAICLFTFATLTPANAGVRGEIKGEGMVISASDQLKEFSGQALYNDPTYEPIQQYLPKPTHQIAATEVCNKNNTLTGECNNLTCTNSQGTQGNIRYLLVAPLDAKNLPDVGWTIGYHEKEKLQAWAKYRTPGTYCSADEPLAKGAVLSETLNFTANDLTQHGLLASKVKGPKNNGLTLVEYNTNIWAEPQEQTINTRILDVPVTARARAQEFVFDYGDGTPQVRRDVPGHFLRDDQWDEPTETTHVYKETGEFEANVMTVFGAEFSVNGGEWLPMAGRAEVWGEGVPVDVWRTDTYLVDSRKAQSKK